MNLMRMLVTLALLHTLTKETANAGVKDEINLFYVTWLNFGEFCNVWT